MSTVVCQRLQSCLESQLVETRTLKLIVAQEKCHFEEDTKKKTQSLFVGGNNTYISSNSELGVWSSLQNLSNTSQSPKQELDKQCSYVPPLHFNQYSPFKLSDKSLELCTENLGSETGTTDLESCSFSFSGSEQDGIVSSRTCEQLKLRQQQQVENSKKANSRSFPPPLKSMTGVSSLQVRSHREGGRLVIEAVETPSRHSCFQAERSDGRLRLCFSKEYDESGVENEECENGEIEEFEDMDDNSFEKGVKKFQWPSRCKESGLSNGRLCNWKTFCVATP